MYLSRFSIFIYLEKKKKISKVIGDYKLEVVFR